MAFIGVREAAIIVAALALVLLLPKLLPKLASRIGSFKDDMADAVGQSKEELAE